MPGWNRCRGLNGVPLKTHTGISVTWETRQAILSGSSKIAPVEYALDDWFDNDDDAQCVNDDDDAQSVGPQSPEDLAKMNGEPCEVFPWEHAELLCRELINMWDPKTIVHYNTGSGIWALASARHCKNYIGFVRNTDHLDYVFKNILCHVVKEMVDGTQDGFESQRFLSRERSLGGSVAAAEVLADLQTPAVEASPTVNSQDKTDQDQAAKTDQNQAAKNDEGSDSDSDSSTA